MKPYFSYSLFTSSLIVAILTLNATTVTAQDAMKPKPTEQASFDVIGIETRTNNAQEASGKGAIPQQWQRLFNEGILEKIPDRADQSVIAVYTNYASDWNGDYTYILGAKVKQGTKTPAGMMLVTVPAGEYVEFESARGPGQKVIADAWKQIWGYFQEPGNPARAYKSDFERYEAMSDPNDIQAHIFMGVKP